MITVLQSYINVKTSSLGSCDESEGNALFTVSAPNGLSNEALKYCIRALNPPVYQMIE
jgi:hypothetical protein